MLLHAYPKGGGALDGMELARWGGQATDRPFPACLLDERVHGPTTIGGRVMENGSEHASDAQEHDVRIEELRHEVSVECRSLHESEEILGGVVCTGFFEVNKLIVIKKCHHHDESGWLKSDDPHDHDREKTLLIETVLPFQLLIARLT